MFSRASCRNSRVLFASSCVIFASTFHDCRRRADAECNSNNKNGKDETDELFQGHCLKRQLYTPKVPYPAWDYNWDGRMTPNTTLESLSKTTNVKGKTRHVIFIRHGQYDETHSDDDKRKLTKLGRVQAHLTGQRLQIMIQGMGDKFGACNITSLTSSDMTRAKETAQIISQHLPHVPVRKPDAMLNEVLPAPIIPVRPEIDATADIDAHAKTMDDVFHKYIYRSQEDTDEDDTHEFEIVVCHGNVIRYIFCRALQIPPEAWLRMSIFNCSMTYLMIKPNGYCSCRMLGDIGHLGYEHVTFSNGHGFVWS